MAETIDFRSRSASTDDTRLRGAELVRVSLARLIEIVGSGSRVFRMNPLLFFLWVLFPLFLVLTSDWIGLLVIFQAITAAVRLQNAPTAKKLAYWSPSSAPASRLKGEYRVLR